MQGDTRTTVQYVSANSPQVVLEWNKSHKSDPSTIQDKFLVGYQGWFTCGGDGQPVDPGHHGWLHWFNYPIPDGGRPNIDLWPDVSEYSTSELFPAPGLKFANGEQAHLFSSRHPKTVQRHFHWMAQYSIDGAFLQRFATEIDPERSSGILRIRDEVLDRVRDAAEKEGRVFSIMYDVSGSPPDRLQMVLERDWNHLVHKKSILDSPSYLKEKGKPVVAIWGFGFENTQHSPALVRSITNFFRRSTPGGAYIFGGAPAHWRTSTSDAHPNPEFVQVWLNEFDAISPWTVGRYVNEDEADSFVEKVMKPDAQLIKKRNDQGTARRVDYVPVVLPGGSGYNMSEGKWGFNAIKRNGGRFLWKQIFNAKRQGVRIMYGAMWDEYDEGTAFMPVVAHKRLLPKSDKFHFMALDEDGYDLPPDWYMRIAGFAAEGLRSERMIHDSFPSKELQDYWGTRQKHELRDDTNQQSGAGFSSGAGTALGNDIKDTEDGGEAQAAYQSWLSNQKDEKDEPPPPPYSLEAAEAEAAAARSRPAAVTTSTTAQQASSISVSSSQSSVAPAPPEQPELPMRPLPNPYMDAGLSQTQSRPRIVQSFSTSSGSGNLSAPSSSPGHSPSGAESPQGPTYSVSSLTSDFSRQNISGLGPDAGVRPGLSPPPLHPRHPASVRPLTPQALQMSSPPPLHPTHPNSQRPLTPHVVPMRTSPMPSPSVSPSNVPSPSQNQPQRSPKQEWPGKQDDAYSIYPGPGEESSGESQWPGKHDDVYATYPGHGASSQWSPKQEWPGTQDDVYPAYSGSDKPTTSAGASLTRPTTYSAGSHNSAQQRLGNYAVYQKPAGGAALSRPATYSAHSMPRPSTRPQQPLTYESSFPQPEKFPMPQVNTAAYPNEAGPSGPYRPPPGPPSIPSSPHSASPTGSYPSRPPSQGMRYSPQNPQTMQFPQGQAPSGYFNQQQHASQQFPQQSPPQQINYPPYVNQSNLPPGPSQFPQGAPYQSPTSGPGYGGPPAGYQIPTHHYGLGGGPPQAAHSPYPQVAGPNYVLVPAPQAGANTGAVGMALNTVEQLAHSGTKLFNKFMK